MITSKGRIMEPMCDFCREVKAVVYCKSDSARLCLNCDEFVHSANVLSRRHARSPLCDNCNAQPAIVRCMDKNLNICPACDRNGNGCLSLGHRRQALNCYTGCPSMAEFVKILSSALEASSLDNFDTGLPSSTLPINDNCIVNGSEQRENKGSFGLVATELNDLESCPTLEPWLESSSVVPPNPNYMSYYCRDQVPLFADEIKRPRDCSAFKDLQPPDDEDICEVLSIGAVPINFGTGDHIFDDVGTDCLLMEKNLSVTESNGPSESALEASSSGQQDWFVFPSSRVGVSPSFMQATFGSSNCTLLNPSCNRNINLGFPTGQVPSNMSLSLSNITGESSAADYQDCGLSPVFLSAESPWESNLETSSPQARDKAKLRYNEKKKTRKFGKQIRYASRKARADTRKRVKGRFVKAGEAYDYDPLVTRNV